MVLFNQIGLKANIVITADHGQIDLPPKRAHFVGTDNPLFSLLKTLPTGEPRAPFFHVKDGCDAEFFDKFIALFGEDFFLLAIEDAADLGLFGIRNINLAVRGRFGDYVAIAKHACTMEFSENGNFIVDKGVHGGLTKNEIEIPLFHLKN